jgi:hypothetical protein
MINVIPVADVVSPLFVNSASEFAGLFAPLQDDVRSQRSHIAALHYTALQITATPSVPLVVPATRGVDDKASVTPPRHVAQLYQYHSFTIEDGQQRQQLIAQQGRDPVLRMIIDYKKNRTVPADLEKSQIDRFIQRTHDYTIDPRDDGLYYIATSSSRMQLNPRFYPQLARLVIPKIYRIALLDLFHNSPFGGHLGISKTYSRLASRYYWPTMWDDAGRFIRQCFTCQQEKIRLSKPPRADEPSLTATEAFDAIALDYIGPLPQSEDFQFVLVIIDVFTRYAITVPCNKPNANLTASALLNVVYCTHGAPRIVLTDQGSPFVAAFLKPLWASLQIDKRQSTTYHPQSNGMVERANGTLKTMLRCACEQHPSTWASKLQMMTFAYNTAVHSATGLSPFFMVFAREPNIPGSMVTPTETVTASDEPELEYLSKLLRSQAEIHEYVRAHLASDAAHETKRRARHIHTRTLSVGDHVLFEAPHKRTVWRDTSVEQTRLLTAQTPSLRHTFNKHYNGPFIVTRILSDKVYEIRPLAFPNAFTDIVNIEHLKLIPKVVNLPTEEVTQILDNTLRAQQHTATHTDDTPMNDQHPATSSSATIQSSTPMPPTTAADSNEHMTPTTSSARTTNRRRSTRRTPTASVVSATAPVLPPIDNSLIDMDGDEPRRELQSIPTAGTRRHPTVTQPAKRRRVSARDDAAATPRRTSRARHIPFSYSESNLTQPLDLAYYRRHSQPPRKP